MEFGHGLRAPFHGFVHLTRGNRVPNPREWAPNGLAKGIKYLVIGDHYISMLGLIRGVYRDISKYYLRLKITFP
jgi:hypothetical protein